MKTFALATVLALSGGAAMAAVETETLIAELQAQGYSWIEVKRGPTQIKVEAVRGEVKVERVYDIATGTVIETETEAASRTEQGRTGVEVGTRRRDFAEVGDDDSDDDGDDSSDDGDDGGDDDSGDDGDDGGDDDGDDGGDDDGDDGGDDDDDDGREGSDN